MPFKGFICEVTGESVTPDECHACARAGALPGCHMTAPMIRGILDGIRPDDFGMTVTTLLSCARKVRLKPEYDYFEKPSSLYYAFRGQLTHSILECATEDDNVIKEIRYSFLTRSGIIVTGQPDLIYTDRKHLVDYKTTKQVPGPVKVWTCPETGNVIFENEYGWRAKKTLCKYCGGEHITADIMSLTPPRPKASHILQLSLYRLILEENGVSVNTAELVYIDMQRPMRMPVYLLPLDQTAELMEARVQYHSDPSMPDVLRDLDTLWECDFCPVRGICERLTGYPVGKKLIESAVTEG